MDLNEIREQINQIDTQIAALFVQRMDTCLQVARYKYQNHMEVFQSDREQQVFNRIAELATPYGDEAVELYTKLMEISKRLQKIEIESLQQKN